MGTLDAATLGQGIGFARIYVYAEWRFSSSIMGISYGKTGAHVQWDIYIYVYG
jgi:hypothetical protein